MFEQIKSKNGTKQTVEDIFGGEKPTATVNQPTQPGSPVDFSSIKEGARPIGPSQPLTSLKDVKLESEIGPGKKKRGPILPILIIIILVIILGAAGYLLYQKFVNAPTVEPLKNLNNQVPINENENANQNESVILNENENLNQTNIGTIIDSDHDGLIDEEEMVLGTDPNEVDSDNDGLYDFEEVKTYQTNPLIPDTDNDGYLDGDEVIHGYNPKGPGKLFNLP